jgi:hypothetical protein
MKSARTKACDISPAVRRAVEERDGGCSVISGMPGIANAHYIPRSKGGLGITENIVTLTPEEHHEFDNGNKHKEYGEKIRAFLDEKYPGFPNEKRIYDRWKL